MHNSYETIDLNEYVRTGEGGTAQAYTHKDGKTLAKLYNPGFEADRAREEFHTARTVYEMGLPTPEPYRLVTDGERYGAEYELIRNKRSYTRIISEEPGRMEELTLKFARLARELHAMEADTSRLRSYKEGILRFYRESSSVPEDYRQAALRFLDTVPDTPRCLHGDLHIGNIITDGQRDLWIDVGEFAYGAPEWDVALLWNMTHNMRAEMADNLFHLSTEALNAHWNLFLPAYTGATDAASLEAATHRLLPFSATKVPYAADMAFHRPLPAESYARLIQLFGQNR